MAKIVEKGREVIDGWVNALTGANIAGVDARVNSMVEWRPLAEMECSALYAADAMAAKIVDKPVDEATKRGYKWTGVTDEEADKLVAALKELHFDEKMQLAWKKARLTGGAGILKLYDDALDLGIPAKQGTKIKSLLVFTKFELACRMEDLQKDILSARFQLPVLYTFQGRGATVADRTEMKIHYTRIVPFQGAWLPDELRSQADWWGDSYLNRCKNAIRNFAHAHDSVNMALKDLSVAVFKVKGLADYLESNNDEAITNRLKAVNLSKSIARAVIVDTEGEDFDYRTRNLTGAADLVEKATDRLVAETDFPKTVLTGGSPQGGLGQSGNHESDNWNSYIESEQANYLKPRMLEIAREKCLEIGIDASLLDVEFVKLWQMSDKDAADIRKVMSEVDKTYQEMGVLDTDEIARARFGGAKYSIETSIDMDERERQVEPAFEPDPADPSRVPPEALAAAQNVQGQALNGAQVTSLVQVASMVQANQLDPDAASGILRLAFPTITPEQVQDIITKSSTVKPASAAVLSGGRITPPASGQISPPAGGQ